MKLSDTFRAYGLLFALASMIVGWATFDLVRERKQLLHAATQTAVQHSNLLAEGLAVFHVSVQHLLNDVLARTREADLREADVSADSRRRLANLTAMKASSVWFLDALSMYDAQCRVQGSDNPRYVDHTWPATTCQALQALEASDRLQLMFLDEASSPLGRPMLALARNFPAESGQFTGGAMATISFSLLQSWLARDKLLPGSSVSIVTAQGQMVAYVPGDGATPTATEASRALLESRSLPQSFDTSRSWNSYSGSTGDAVFGISNVEQMPFYVVSGRSDAAILADWYKHLLQLFVAAVCLVALLAYSTRAYLQLGRQREAMARLACTDPLTGLYNRRHFFEAGEREIERSRRHNQPLSLLIIDADHFKQVNDQFGHQAGDQLLREVTRIIRDTLRTSDILARYGGEEFAIILPQTSRPGAFQLAERLRAAVAAIKLDAATGRGPREGGSHGVLQVSISIGVTQLRDDDSMDTLLDRADNALYKAKNEGRNRVVDADQLSA